MKIVLVSDTHFNFRKSNQIYHDYFERFYTDVFFPTLEDRRIDTAIHLGDAFDNRKGVDYWALDWAQRVFYDRLSDLNINLIQICGNHDSFYKNSNKINAIDTLFEKCLRSNKWKKWVSKDFNPYENKIEVIKICCHYIFSTKDFVQFKKENLSDSIDLEIKNTIKNRIKEILL